MKRRSLWQAAIALLAAGALRIDEARAQAGAAKTAAPTPAFVEGRDYTRLDPAQPSHTPGKVEVIEFFSYACPHCKEYDPVLQAWVDKLPADVAFRRVPLAGMYNAQNFMRAYYALESLGLLGKLHPKVFAAVHEQKLRLDQPEEIAALVARNGGDAAKFLAAFKSFAVATAVNRATQLNNDYRIDSVPTLTIGGVYETSVETAKGGQQEMPTRAAQDRSLLIANALIDRVRRSGPR